MPVIESSLDYTAILIVEVELESKRNDSIKKKKTAGNQMNDPEK